MIRIHTSFVDSTSGWPPCPWRERTSALSVEAWMKRNFQTIAAYSAARDRRDRTPIQYGT